MGNCRDRRHPDLCLGVRSPSTTSYLRFRGARGADRNRARSRAAAEIAKGVSWSVLPLVAGLFVLVEALNRAGALRAVGHVLRRCAEMPRLAGSLAASFGIAALSNVMNNLPSGLLAGAALQTFQAPSHIRDAVLIGVNLDPICRLPGPSPPYFGSSPCAVRASRSAAGSSCELVCWLCLPRYCWQLWH